MTREQIALEDKAKIKKGYLTEIVASDIYDSLGYLFALREDLWKETPFKCVALERMRKLEKEHNIIRIRTWRKNLKITVEEENAADNA